MSLGGIVMSIRFPEKPIKLAEVMSEEEMETLKREGEILKNIINNEPRKKFSVAGKIASVMRASDVLSEDNPKLRMDFSEALKCLKEGRRVTRSIWGGWWEMKEVPGLTGLTIVAHLKDDAGDVPAQPYQQDILATDWIALDPPKYVGRPDIEGGK
jgi:hypothetical protein